MNPKNPSIERNFESFAKTLAYRFNDLELLKQAFTHRSAKGPNNERLEFLGDAVLGFVVADMLYTHFPNESEGDLSRVRANLVNQRSLAAEAKALGLGDFLSLGPGEKRTGGFQRNSILSDVFEALLGAMYLDGGFDEVKRFVASVFQPRIDALPDLETLKDPKTRLQEWLQSRGMALPEYDIIETQGEAHAQTFTVECVVPELSLTEQASGTSRRRAEQAAASEILRVLKKANS